MRLFDGVPCPLVCRKPGDIDFLVVREHTEGEYSAIGGRMFEGTEREVVLQETVMTRHGVDRVRPALRLRPRQPPATPQAHLGHQIQRHRWTSELGCAAACDLPTGLRTVAVQTINVDTLVVTTIVVPRSAEAIRRL